MVQHLCPDDRALVDLLDGLVGHDGTPLLHVRLATVERTLEKKFDKYSCYAAASWTHADALVEAAVQGSTTCVAGTRVTKWVALDGAPSTAGNRHFEWSASGMDVGNGIDWDAGTAADRRVYKPLWNPKGHKAVSLTHRATLVVVWPRRRGLQLAASGGLTSPVNYVERRHGSGSGGSSDGIGCRYSGRRGRGARPCRRRRPRARLVAPAAGLFTQQRYESLGRGRRCDPDGAALHGARRRGPGVRRGAAAGDEPTGAQLPWSGRSLTQAAAALAALLEAIGKLGWDALERAVYAMLLDPTSHGTAVVAGLLAVLAPSPDVLVVAKAAAEGSPLDYGLQTPAALAALLPKPGATAAIVATPPAGAGAHLRRLLAAHLVRTVNKYTRPDLAAAIARLLFHDPALAANRTVWSATVGRLQGEALLAALARGHPADDAAAAATAGRQRRGQQ